MLSGSISKKAGKKLDAKLAMLRGTRPQKSKMASFHDKKKDEGELKNKGIHDDDYINDPKVQGGSAAYGRHVSKGGGIGKAESQVGRKQIDQPENKKVWPRGGDVSASNPKTGNTEMKGPIARSGGLYGGGGRGTQ